MARISRGETYIGNLSVSLMGGIQPARLGELRGLTSDGLLQRFVPVPEPEARTRIGEVPTLGRSLVQQAMIPPAAIERQLAGAEIGPVGSFGERKARRSRPLLPR